MATTHVEIPASIRGGTVTVLVDCDDHARLGGRGMSIGSHGYAQIWDGSGMVLLHRWIMGVPVGVGYRVIVDHINRDPLDCRRSNLRLVSPTASNLNRAIAGRELPVGVYRTWSGRFEARIKRRGRYRHLGTFGTVEEAAGRVAAERARVDRDVFAPVVGVAA